VIDDPAVSALHARIAQGPGGGFVLTDEKSAAGTWVNFEQINTPYTLKHGDIFHIGRMSYRFMLRTPPTKTGPHLTPHKS
jgi:pSer/pThr/pTyr-binding forkhead associated (FHA) protein